MPRAAASPQSSLDGWSTSIRTKIPSTRSSRCTCTKTNLECGAPAPLLRSLPGQNSSRSPRSVDLRRPQQLRPSRNIPPAPSQLRLIVQDHLVFAVEPGEHLADGIKPHDAAAIDAGE